ncbi:MAG: protein kinase, partial [Gemmataceae bacterium]|nr:protein kinase [Gemmataceae bacterium]
MTSPADPTPDLPSADVTTGYTPTPTGSDRTRDHSPGPRDCATPDGLPVVPGYCVSREIARGGMAVVYAAHDPVFDREVAVKVMHPGQDADRFVVESKVTAHLPHPGIPPVYTLGKLPDGRPFLAMKLIRGRTLAAELDGTDRLVELPRLLGMFEQICQTVGFAHAQGVIHRDLKPLNVMVGSFGEVQVMDWGLAKEIARGEQVTQTEGSLAAGTDSAPDSTTAGQARGTPSYMAPEQARGEPVDARADVFALGGILNAILTGQPPFLGDSVGDRLRKSAGAELSDTLARLDACGVDADLVAIAKRCLAAQAGDRFASGQEVAGAIAAYRAGVEERLRQAERDRAVSAAEAREQRKRRKVQLALTAAVLLIVAGGGAFAWWQERQATDRKATEARLAGERDTEERIKVEQARQGVSDNRRLAGSLRKLSRFHAADEALKHAATLARSGAPELLAEVEQARSDLAFVVRLDDIRYRKWVYLYEPGGTAHPNTLIASPEYHKAFVDRGLDLKTLDPAEAARRITASTVKDELVAAVDDWALHEPDTGVRIRLLAIAHRADPGPWLDRLRDPDVWGDRKAIEKLAADARPADLSPAALSTLARLMWAEKLDAATLFSTARAEHPTSFDLAFACAVWHSYQDDGQELGPLEAACALRPENAAAWGSLGISLAKKKHSAGAITALRKAIHLDPTFAPHHFNLGSALFEKGDLDGALAQFKECV